MTEMEVLQRGKSIIEQLCEKSIDDLPFCQKTTRFQINHFIERGGDRQRIKKRMQVHFHVGEIMHGQYIANRISNEVWIVSGNFCLRDRGMEGNLRNAGTTYTVNIIFRDRTAVRIMLTGSRSEQVVYQARADEDHFYMLTDYDVIYVESDRNYVIFHCREEDVRVRETLTKVGKSLPACFCQVHRSFIVNTKHIKAIKEREIVLDNNDMVELPVRSYRQKKKELLEMMR
ncbi:MAG: LytTR family transcriptional regulator [Clostridiaceae bacterium]|nr:LytTR family transcriptional regulator [Clostridiaceae bacterium]